MMLGIVYYSMVTVLVLLFSLFILVVGVLQVVWPYKMARHDERWDAIGSKRRKSEIEPKEWKVKFTRFGGVIAIIIGILLLWMAI